MDTRTDSDYSINYSLTAGGLDANNIVIPGGGTSSQLAKSKKERKDDAEGVVITPDPSGIVIKTRLLKEKQTSFSFDDDNFKDSNVPPSLSSIYASTQSDFRNAACTENEAGSKEGGNDETKVFLNICTHPLIAVPAQRKGLDEQTGKEVDGWRLPMSMGDLRPCCDRSGNAAIVADCILNPIIIREMNSDSNHFQFVCDLIVQCASRKFGQKWFGGCELDRRFKLPKMKYAGYVDEATGLPIMPPGSADTDLPTQKVVVAKQRVKGHGGKPSIIEEVRAEGGPPKATAGSSGKALIKSGTGAKLRKQTIGKSKLRIELFVGDSDNNHSIPLFDFLQFAADQDGILPQGQPSSMLRDLIKSPKLKPQDDKNEKLHESQLLNAPMPFDITMIPAKLSALSLSQSAEGYGSDDIKVNFDCWGIIAKCSVSSNLPEAVPAVELSAFLLVLTTSNSKTECTLPFAVNTHRSSTTYNAETGMVEIAMPLLTSALIVEACPDPGTRPWELQNALGSDNNVTASVDDKRVEKRESSSCDKKSQDSSQEMFGSYFIDAGVGDENVDDNTQPLPEDAFHLQDVLSQHLLQQREDEQKERAAHSDRQVRDEEDVEYINVDEFRQTPHDHDSKEDYKSTTLKKAQCVMKNNLKDCGSIMASDLISGLV